MAHLIGIDEAGLGPNFGPYVVTATVWETPGEPANTDLWRLFSEVATATPQSGDDRLHIADSKAVFQPAKGLAALERSVLCTLGLLPAGDSTTDRRLRRRLCGDDDRMETDPWYDGDDLPLPMVSNFDDLCETTRRWKTVMDKTGVRLAAVQSAIVEPRCFNALIDQHQNKAEALSLTSLRLLKQAAALASESNTLAWCDKHGGRNRYDLLMSQCFDGELAFRVRESAELSVYRLGNLEVRFLPRAEVQFPVALASMISKYVRELAMLRFNRFWAARVPDLKPTQGYPVDARRFREAIQQEQQRLGIDDAVVWRCR